MDYAQARAILDKYGEDRCIQIIFDNGRVWLINRMKPHDDPIKRQLGYKKKDANGKYVFYKFSELVEFDEETDTVKFREHQHGVDSKSHEAIRWDIVNPIECIQGFNFLPPDLTPEEEYLIRTQWDVHIT